MSLARSRIAWCRIEFRSAHDRRCSPPRPRRSTPAALLARRPRRSRRVRASSSLAVVPLDDRLAAASPSASAPSTSTPVVKRRSSSTAVFSGSRDRDVSVRPSTRERHDAEGVRRRWRRRSASASALGVTLVEVDRLEPGLLGRAPAPRRPRVQCPSSTRIWPIRPPCLRWTASASWIWPSRTTPRSFRIWPRSCRRVAAVARSPRSRSLARPRSRRSSRRPALRRAPSSRVISPRLHELEQVVVEQRSSRACREVWIVDWDLERLVLADVGSRSPGVIIITSNAATRPCPSARGMSTWLITRDERDRELRADLLLLVRPGTRR